jgi:polysaccharide pyruvyl transferase WcaK-like protein
MYKKIVEFRPSISSENIGNHIIQLYTTDLMNDLFGEHLTVTMPTRSYLTNQNLNHINTADYSFVCGTNLLASNMDKRHQWNLRRSDMFRLHDVILLGVGWWQYQENPNLYTRMLLKNVLNPNVLHSVRDGYTEKMLKAAGIENVINMGCPTMWKLTEKVVDKIPTYKGKTVITTLTNYMQNDEQDHFIMDMLLSNYKTVYVWLQAIEDYEQLCRMGYEEKVHIIPPTLKAYSSVLENSDDVDYVGTRLHGGIHALNKERRSLIIAVDNRAVEISRDTGLPVIKRENVKQELEHMICDSWKTEIMLPLENIEKWKKQFKSETIEFRGENKLITCSSMRELIYTKEACA